MTGHSTVGCGGRLHPLCLRAQNPALKSVLCSERCVLEEKGAETKRKRAKRKRGRQREGKEGGSEKEKRAAASFSWHSNVGGTRTGVERGAIVEHEVQYDTKRPDVRFGRVPTLLSDHLAALQCNANTSNHERTAGREGKIVRSLSPSLSCMIPQVTCSLVCHKSSSA
eukprot:SAG11_NODE_3096_length_2698_cov_1.560215_1_plen_168_part_00